MPNLGGNSADETSEMASGSTMTPNTELRKRRSTRIVQAVPLAVTGVDALGRPFAERTSTLIINCHGCRYQSKHYVLKNMWVTLEIPHPESGHATRSVRGRVAWIQRPRTVRQLFQVALELEQPGNAWGMAFPPEDWFGFPEAEKQHSEDFAEGAGETSGLQELPEGHHTHGGSQGTPGTSAEFNLAARRSSGFAAGWRGQRAHIPFSGERYGCIAAISAPDDAFAERRQTTDSGSSA